MLLHIVCFSISKKWPIEGTLGLTFPEFARSLNKKEAENICGSGRARVLMQIGDWICSVLRQVLFGKPQRQLFQHSQRNQGPTQGPDNPRVATISNKQLASALISTPSTCPRHWNWHAHWFCCVSPIECRQISSDDQRPLFFLRLMRINLAAVVALSLLNNDLFFSIEMSKCLCVSQSAT